MMVRFQLRHYIRTVGKNRVLTPFELELHHVTKIYESVLNMLVDDPAYSANTLGWSWPSVVDDEVRRNL